MIKKLLLGVFVFSLLLINNHVNAATVSSNGCSATNAYSATTGQKCAASGAVLGVSLTVTPDPTPRIMYWSGKVNQHIDVNGVWQSDPDGTSGANLDKLTYCKKWYPNTTSVTPYQMETIDTWRRAAGFEQSGYTATIMSDKCVADVVQTSTITVLSPNGGESYQAGQQVTITWNTANVSGNITEIDLIDSMGWGGGTGLTFDKEIPNTGSYTATLPTASDFAQANASYGKYFSIKIYAANGAIQDSSDNLFTIQASATTNDTTPRIMYWHGKVNQHIDASGAWQTDPDGISGSTIDKVTYCKKWYPTTTTTTPYQMETISTWHDQGNVNNYTATIMSDKCVTSTQQTPSITVVSPNGGQIYQSGQQVTINWNSTNIPPNANVRAFIVNENQGASIVVTGPGNGWTNNDGQESITIPTLGTWGNVQVQPGNFYKLAMEVQNMLGVIDSSDNLFTIQALTTTTCPVSTPSIKVLSPNGGEVYQAGQQVTVNWQSCNISTSDLVDIFIQHHFPQGNGIGGANYAANLIPSGNGTMNDGTEVVTLPTQYSGRPFGQYFKILVVKHPYSVTNTINDISDNLFTIQAPTMSTCTATSDPYVKIVSPTDGSSYTSGQQLLVKWTSCRFLPTDIGGLTIMSLDGTQYPFTLNTINDGQELITIPTAPINGQYTFVIKFNGAGYAASDSVHINIQNSTISTCPASSVPKVTVLVPNGGENYIPGQQITATWKTCKISANAQMRIDIVMYKPNGNTVTKVLKSSTPNDGTENITLPTNVSWPQMVYGTNFKIKIRKANSANPQDLSDNKFTIIPAVPAKVTVMLSSTNPQAGTVIVNNTANTNNVEVLKFKIKAENSDLLIKKIPIQVNISSTATADDVTNIINSIKLMSGTNVIDSKSGTDGYQFTAGTASNFTGGTACTNTSSAADDLCAFQFSNLSAPYNTIDAGSTAEFSIVIDFKSQANYAAGTMITTSFVNADVFIPTNFSVQDVNGDQLPSSQRFGSAIGNPQTLRTNGVSVVMNNPLYTHVTDTSGNITEVTYTIPLSVSAYGGDYYMGQTAQRAVSATSTNAFAYGYNIAQTPTILNIFNGDSSILTSLDANIVGNGYRLDDGTTKHFTLTVVLTTPTTPNSMYRVVLQEIRVFTNNLLTVGATNISLLPASSYQTGYQLINN